MVGFHIAFDDARGVSRDERSRRHISYDDACRRYDAIVPDSDPRQNYRVCANETIVANTHVTIASVDMVVRQNGDTECDNCVLPDVDASRIGLVESRTERDNRSLPDIHSPDPN